ncbi:MAG: serine/threonine protein kinase [Lentisphaeraceae bacterium]|nr:serine/threonine protein kinase [Lentisphaeraceae bacterium]
MKLNNPCLQCNEIITATLDEMRHIGTCPHCGEDPGQMDCNIKVGDTIGSGFTLQEKIAEDSFGTRFLATGESDAMVQVKVLPNQIHPDEDAKARFLREIELLSKIRHDGVIAVLESGQDESAFYLITEYHDGIDLKSYIKNEGQLNEKDATNLIMPVVETLKAVWESNAVVHRDIKPEKIFLTDDNKVKIVDIGLAKSLENDSMDLTGAGFTVGTPDYLSPEQAEGKDLDFKSDMYSLGLVYYELVTGQQAFSGDVMDVLSKQINDMPTRAFEVNTKVSERCSKTIDKMIAKSPDERFESWDRCLESLSIILDTTILQTDLQTFDLNELMDEDDDFEPSMENLNQEDDGAFSSAKKNASGIILEEEEADNDLNSNDETLNIEAGSIIGNGYEIDRKLGDGSMGQIFLAFSEERDALVQVKVLPAHMSRDKEKLERFLQEIKIASSLKHENLLSAIEAGEDRGNHYLVTEYEEGISLHDHIGRYAPLPEKDSIHFLMQIAEVLRYAWNEKKLLHREVKPKNILVLKGNENAKLTDFGIAKVMKEDTPDLTGMGFTIGTPEYMSPEQVCGDEDLDPRSDMYALGLVLYEALTKKKAFESSNVMTLMNMQMKEAHKNIVDLNSKVSPTCKKLVDKLLEKDRNNRFNDWDELIEAMQAIKDGRDFETNALNPKEKPLTKLNIDSKPTEEAQHSPSVETEEKKSPLLFIGVGLILVVIILLVVLFK